MPYRQQLETICSGLLADRSGWVYVHAMAATTLWMRDLPTAAAGAIGAGMSFTICADMSLSTVVPQVKHSG